jgi:hypothetical protein
MIVHPVDNLIFALSDRLALKRRAYKVDELFTIRSKVRLSVIANTRKISRKFTNLPAAFSSWQPTKKKKQNPIRTAKDTGDSFATDMILCNSFLLDPTGRSWDRQVLRAV